jgi:hypothetical protein
MKTGDRVIYNTGFGYDLGVFVREGGIYNTFLVELVTGRYPGNIAADVHTITPYTDADRDRLAEKYGYRWEWVV